MRRLFALIRSPLPVPWGAWWQEWAGLIIVGATLLYTLLFGVWVMYQPGSVAERALISDWAFVIMGVAVSLMALYASLHPALDEASRRAWRLLALAYGVLALADTIWTYYEIGLGQEPFPSIADLFYLLYFPIALRALLSFPTVRLTRPQHLRFWLDLTALMVGSALVVWYLILSPLARDSSAGLLATLLAVAYPVGDLMLIFGIIIVLLRGVPQSSQGALLLLVSGLVVYIAADLLYAYQELKESYQGGNVVDALWMVASWVVLLSAYYQRRYAALPAPPPVPARLPALLHLLAYLWVVVAYGLTITVALQGEAQRLGEVLVGAGTLTALVLLRQVTVLRENSRLLGETAQMAEEMRQSEARFRALVQNASDALIICDWYGVISFESPAVTRILGYSLEERLGLSGVGFIHEEDRPQMAKAMRALIHEPGGSRALEMRVRHKDGSWRWLAGSISNLMEEPGVQGFVVNYRDVSQRRTLEEELRRQAFHDPLTGLANRTLLQQRVEGALSEAHASGGLTSLLFLDLDGFKTINDSLGHQAGDELLRGVAERLLSSVRTGDTVARLGGDEFAILLERVPNKEEPRRIARRLLGALAQPFELHHRAMSIGVSIGVALDSDGTLDAGVLLRNADLAMYRAKSAGKGRYVFFEAAMHEAVVRQLEIATGLAAAIEGGQWLLHYQPIVRLADGAIHGIEALVRWQHPSYGLLYPAEFLPLVEEQGLSGSLGAWVQRTALADWAAWQPHWSQLAPLHLHLNLTCTELTEEDDFQRLSQTLAEAERLGCPLVFELSERRLMHGAECLRALVWLHAQGVDLALDDFGVGLSALGTLQDASLTFLKMDRTFVAPLQAGQQLPLAQALIGVGETLALTLIAEGIEHPQQLERLRALGCPLGQGFLIAAPLDAAQLAPLLAAGQIALPPPG